MSYRFPRNQENHFEAKPNPRRIIGKLVAIFVRTRLFESIFVRIGFELIFPSLNSKSHPREMGDVSSGRCNYVGTSRAVL